MFGEQKGTAILDSIQRCGRRKSALACICTMEKCGERTYRDFPCAQRTDISGWAFYDVKRSPKRWNSHADAFAFPCFSRLASRIGREVVSGLFGELDLRNAAKRIANETGQIERTKLALGPIRTLFPHFRERPFYWPSACPYRPFSFSTAFFLRCQT